MAEILVDLEGYDALAPENGERFRGWYRSKTRVRMESHPLNYEDKNLMYNFKVCDYNYKFVMPMKIEFSEGMIAYSDAERLLGVFRFPQKEDGRYSAPVSLEKTVKDIENLSEDEIRELLKNRKVLTFEAFRIPQYGYEYVSIETADLEDIARLTDRGFARAIREQFESEINRRENEVKEKIKSSPNYLLILQSVLDFRQKNVAEVSYMTNNIIHV